MLRITDIDYVKDYELIVLFSDGIQKRVDLHPYLTGEVFGELLDKDKFIQYGLTRQTIEWSNGADLAPEFLYEIGTEIKPYKASQEPIRVAESDGKYSKQSPVLNDHNKQEYPPMHAAEHILNQTMGRMFGCPRSRNSHIERKKSKCDYILPAAPSPEQIAEIENKVNEIIAQHLPVTAEFVTRSEIPANVDTSKLPEDASETLRIVCIGEYDTCACIGLHVGNTSEIGRFKIISTDYQNNTLRIRFKLEE